MSARIHSSLAWLPAPPADFRARCDALAAASGDATDALRQLASWRLDGNALGALARTIATLDPARLPPDRLTPLRLGLVCNATTDFIIPALAATAIRFGIRLDVVATPFNQAAQAALDPGSALNRARPDIVLLALDHRDVLRDRDRVGAAGRAAAIEHLRSLRAAIRAGCGVTCIMQTVPPPAGRVFGHVEARLPDSTAATVDAFNRAVVTESAANADLLLDLAWLAGVVGLAEWHDPTHWLSARLPFAQRLVPLYAEHLCRVLAAWRGRTRRCLVLDLDNTLWGGVIGEDGLAGIRLGPGDPVGEAFLEVQRMALALNERGVVLAVASRNDDAVARQPFREHPAMLLNEAHIAAFQANWRDKASNLQAIAERLGLGLDALVLLEDDPAERALVRQALPEVAVPELPGDPALIADTVLAAGYFETVALSPEDRVRAAYYRSDAERKALKARLADVDTYLASLEMVAEIRPFDQPGRRRIAQLVNKTNQFNLTTRRFAEAEIAALEADPAVATYQVRLSDSFGDNGMIAVAICRKCGADWEIDSWLMSCRVIGRRIEQAMLAAIAEDARSAGAARLIGRYRPTARNGVVRDLYRTLGFACIAQAADGASDWALELARYRRPALPVRIERPGAGTAAATRSAAAIVDPASP